MRFRTLVPILLIIPIALSSCVVPMSGSPTPTLFLLPTDAPTSPPPTPSPVSGAVEIILTPTPLFGAATIASIGDHEPGICEHLLWPILDGTTWTYLLTSRDSTTELSIMASVDEYGATLSSDDNVSRIQCGSGILAGLPPFPIAHPALGMNVSGNNPSGEYLPSGAILLPLGQPAQWDMDVEAAGAIRISQIGGETALPINGGRIAIIQVARELETVSVPAGEFVTLPVWQDVLMDLHVQTQGVSVESVIISATLIVYYAEGVGPVKVDYMGGTLSSPSGAWSLASDSHLELVRTTGR